MPLHLQRPAALAGDLPEAADGAPLGRSESRGCVLGSRLRVWRTPLTRQTYEQSSGVLCRFEPGSPNDGHGAPSSMPRSSCPIVARGRRQAAGYTSDASPDSFHTYRSGSDSLRSRRARCLSRCHSRDSRSARRPRAEGIYRQRGAERGTSDVPPASKTCSTEARQRESISPPPERRSPGLPGSASRTSTKFLKARAQFRHRGGRLTALTSMERSLRRITPCVLGFFECSTPQTS